MYAKFSKCKFWLTSIHFLGHKVSLHGIKVDPQKVEAIANWCRPFIITKIHNFLGFVGHYHKFVDDFLKITPPLIKLT